MAYIGLLIAGILLCNGLPHLLAGLQGRTFFTPWTLSRGDGKASPLENVLWGCGNLLVAVFLIDRIFPKNVPHGLVILSIGFLGTAAGLAMLFERRRADS